LDDELPPHDLPNYPGTVSTIFNCTIYKWCYTYQYLNAVNLNRFNRCTLLLVYKLGVNTAEQAVPNVASNQITPSYSNLRLSQYHFTFTSFTVTCMWYIYVPKRSIFEIDPGTGYTRTGRSTAISWTRAPCMKICFDHTCWARMKWVLNIIS